MFIRLPKALLESMHLVRAIPKAEWRSQLTGITMMADGTIWAANGHIALVARTDIVVERDCVLSIEKTPAAGKKYHTAIVNTADKTCSFIPEFPGIDDTAPEDCIAMRLAVVKADEVQVNRIIELANPVPPNPQPVTEIIFDADYLAMLPKISDLFEKQEGGKFAFALTGSQTAALIKVKAGQPYKMTVIMMPIIL